MRYIIKGFFGWCGIYIICRWYEGHSGIVGSKLTGAFHMYESPFSSLHSGSPNTLSSGKKNVIEGIFKKLGEVNTGLISKAS
jgi:hypothetical protein